MKFENILELVENELIRRQERAKEFYGMYCKLEKENKKLKQENEILRKDLAEYTKELLKLKKWQDQEKQKD
jgi:cell division septum initiation protein DivIVA